MRLKTNPKTLNLSMYLVPKYCCWQQKGNDAHMLASNRAETFFCDARAHPSPAGHTQLSRFTRTAGGWRPSLTDEGRLTHLISGSAQRLDQTRMGCQPIHPLNVLQHFGHAHATGIYHPRLSVGRLTGQRLVRILHAGPYNPGQLQTRPLQPLRSYYNPGQLLPWHTASCCSTASCSYCCGAGTSGPGSGRLPN